MKIVKSSSVASALMIGVAAAAYAQAGNPGARSANGAQSGVTGNTGAVAGTGVGTAAGTSPAPGISTMGGAGAGPALNNMRANGTSLNMNPDPRVPNLAGKGMPSRN